MTRDSVVDPNTGEGRQFDSESIQKNNERSDFSQKLVRVGLTFFKITFPKIFQSQNFPSLFFRSTHSKNHFAVDQADAYAVFSC